VEQVRPEVYKAISENDMDNVIFSDPFSDIARKSKRNLVATGFIGLLISVLNLEVSGFLGLKATNMNLGNELAQGLAFFILLYFMSSFIFHAYIDYSAWNFKSEKQLTKPYLDLVHLVDRQINTTGQQILNTTSKLDSLSNEESMQAQVNVINTINSIKQQIESIDTQLSAVILEVKPLVSSWRDTIQKMNKLSYRLRARFFSLWFFDIILPLIVAIAALFECYSGVPALVLKLTS
jgi:hypothetical protein